MVVAHSSDMELFYLEVGEGAPCLARHDSFGFDHEELQPWLDSLGDAMRLVYYDHQDNGRPDRSCLETLIYHPRRQARLRHPHRARDRGQITRLEQLMRGEEVKGF